MFAYRMWGRRLPARYDAWVWDDLTGALYGVRQTFPVAMVVVCSGVTSGPEAVASSLIAWIAVLLLFSRVVRREALRRYFPPAPAPRVIGPEGFRYVPRRRFAARPTLAATALIGLVAAGTLLGACTFATAGYHQPGFAALGTTFALEVPQRGYSAGLLAALGVGGAAVAGLATLVLLVGVPRRAHDRPDQPHRVLVGGGRTTQRAAAVIIAVAASSAVLIANDLWLDVTGIVAGTLGSLVGSAALVGWLVVRRVERDGGPPLALRDVARLAGPRRRRALEPEPLAPVWTRPDPYPPPDPYALPDPYAPPAPRPASPGPA
jgi:hypothetical protein